MACSLRARPAGRELREGDPATARAEHTRRPPGADARLPHGLARSEPARGRARRATTRSTSQAVTRSRPNRPALGSVDRADVAARGLRYTADRRDAVWPPAEHRPGHPRPDQGALLLRAYPAKAMPDLQKGRPGRRHGCSRASSSGISGRCGPSTPSCSSLPGREAPSPEKIAAPAFAINDSAWLAPTSIGGATGQPIVTVNGTGPSDSRRWTMARRSASPAMTPTRHPGGERAGDRACWRDKAAPRGRAAGGDGRRHRSARRRRGRRASSRRQPPGWRGQGLNMVYLGFTASFAPFGDVRVRRARDGHRPAKARRRFLPPRVDSWPRLQPVHDPEWLRRSGAARLRPAAGQGAPHGRRPGRVRRRRSATARRPPYLPDPTGIATEMRQQLLDNLGHSGRRSRSSPTTPSMLTSRQASSTGSTSPASRSYPDAQRVSRPAVRPGSKELGDRRPT